MMVPSQELQDDKCGATYLDRGAPDFKPPVILLDLHTSLLSHKLKTL